MTKLVFKIDEAQVVKLEAWFVEQSAKKRMPRTAIGGAFTYSFTPNSIGTTITVRNANTKDEIDLSDYESW